jgi:hypothetical protein
MNQVTTFTSAIKAKQSTITPATATSHRGLGTASLETNPSTLCHVGTGVTSRIVVCVGQTPIPAAIAGDCHGRSGFDYRSNNNNNGATSQFYNIHDANLYVIL